LLHFCALVSAVLLCSKNPLKSIKLSKAIKCHWDCSVKLFRLTIVMFWNDWYGITWRHFVTDWRVWWDIKTFFAWTDWETDIGKNFMVEKQSKKFIVHFCFHFKAYISVYPAYLWSLRWVYAVKKNPKVGVRRIPVYGVYPRIPPNTPLCVMSVFFTFSMQTKFEMSSFICSKDVAWAPKCRNESRDPDHAHLGKSGITRLILHAAKQYMKFEFSTCSCCRDISKGVKI